MLQCPDIRTEPSTRGIRMSLKICVLSSGSSGNMVHLQAEGETILIDAGISSRETGKRMAALGLAAETVRAVLISHEHADHCKGAPVLARKLGVPLYMTEGTAEAFRSTFATNGRETTIRTFQTGESIQIGPFLVEPFPTPHDAADSCGFVLWYRDIKASVVTDLGHLPLFIRKKIQGSRLLVLESNHDESMLWAGRYPWWLKQRILSRHGHLSNRTVAAYIREEVEAWCEYLFLAHISKENNSPELALRATMEALDERGNRSTRVVMTSQDEPTPVIEID